MTTTYYISYRIRKSNGVRVDYASKDFETEAEARSYYERKMAQPSVRGAYLWKVDHYSTEEMVDPDAHPNGKDHFTALASYGRF